MGIKGIVAGKVSGSCCQPHPHHTLVLPALDSGCSWSLKVHKARIAQGAGDQPGHSLQALVCQSVQDRYSHHHGCVSFPSSWDAKLLPD